MELTKLRLIFWETTVGCNLECVHCRRLETSRFLSKEDLPTETAKRFIEELGRNFDPPPVLVLSGGEPLVRPDIFELARFARDRGVPVALASNGTMINKALAKKIVESGIRRVSISLDGARSKTHDPFRRMPGSFRAALRGFCHLKKAGMPVQMNVTLTRHNLHELEAIYALAEKLEVDSLHYFLLVPVGCGAEIKNNFQLTPQEYEDTLLAIREQASSGRIHIRPICAPHYFRILLQNPSPGLKFKTQDSMNQMTRGCLAGTGICFVSHKGEVFPCGYLPVSCGNIRYQTLEQVWNEAPIFKFLRDPSYLEGKCGVCEYKKVCSGCRARAYEEYGDFLDEEPNCLYEPRSFRKG